MVILGKLKLFYQTPGQKKGFREGGPGKQLLSLGGVPRGGAVKEAEDAGEKRRLSWEVLGLCQSKFH